MPKALIIIGIVLLSLIVLAVLLFVAVMFIPIRYKIGGSNKEKLYAYLTISYLLSIIRVTVYYREKMGYVRFRLFGIKIFDNTFPEIMDFIDKVSEKLDSLKKKKDDKKESSEETQTEDENTIPDPDEEEYTITEEEAEEFINGHDEIEDMNAVKKNLSFLGWLKDIVLNIKEKWYNFKEFVLTSIEKYKKFKKIAKFYWKVLNHPSFKPTLVLFKDIFIKVIRHVFPRTWKMKLVYGDKDPYLTGKVSGYVYMARGYFNKEIDFTPVWDESIFEIDGYVKGRIQIYVFLTIAFKLFTNKHLRRMIILIRRGGKKINGGK